MSDEIEPLSPSDQPGVEGSVTGLFSRLKNSDPAVLGEIWRRFFPRMAGLARKALGARRDGAQDADDVVQCAMLSFWNAMDHSSPPEFRDRDDLWRFLGVITVRKARRISRHANARKRSDHRTLSESQIASSGSSNQDDDFRLDRVLTEITPPDFDLFCEEMLLALEEAPRQIALLRLQGHSSAEIAAQLECSERSVQRSLKAIRERWTQLGDAF
jgi:RNA polymerase sigma factor (sigma-70 family)